MKKRNKKKQKISRSEKNLVTKLLSYLYIKNPLIKELEVRQKLRLRALKMLNKRR